MPFGGGCRASSALPPRPRKPLTVIEEFNLLVDKRAVEREEFDKKVSSNFLLIQYIYFVDFFVSFFPKKSVSYF